MSRKRAKKAPRTEPTLTKHKAKSRDKVVLSIVETDNTFKRLFGQELLSDHRLPPKHIGWQGKCIHCNRRVIVTTGGETVATIEHIKPLCDGGDPTDPRNLALACSGCNNEKGIRHDMHAGKGGRADEVIAQLQVKRKERWQDPEPATG